MYVAWGTYRPIFVVICSITILIWIVNYFLYGLMIPFRMMGGILLILVPYSTVLYLSFLMLMDQRAGRKRRWLAVLLLVLVYLTVFDVLYWVIYDHYPTWGIVLFAPDVPFSQEYFRSRIVSDFVGLTCISLAVALYRLFWLGREQMTSLLAEMELLKDRFSSAHIYPHFVESVTATVIGRSLLRNSMGGRRSLEQLAGVMRYVLDRQAEPDQLVSLEEEWKQVNRMAGVVRWMYGKDSMRVRLEGRVDPGLMIIPVSMVLLLENSLKHADMVGEGCIEIRLHGWENGFRFICTNPVDQKGADKAPAAGRAASPDTGAGGFGLQDLERRIERSGLDMGLNIIETDQQFRIELFQRVHQLGSTG